MSQAGTVHQVELCDSTLRDGNHAVRHQLDAVAITAYCRAAEAAGLDVVEVGHGNGLGASSLQVGRAALADVEMLEAARAELAYTRLGTMAMPGFAQVERDLKPAIACGVDEIRVGAHCTEADVTGQQLTVLRDLGVAAKGILMMTHMASAVRLLEQARVMEGCGAEAVILMDSAGALDPDDVAVRVGTLVDGLGVAVGFHAHNNRGLAIANVLSAVANGAAIIDVTARGFGAGAGNAPLELVAANLHAQNIPTRTSLYGALDAADLADESFVERVPTNDAVTVVSGLAGVFSGYASPVRRAADAFGVDPRDILFELGRRGVVAGQEDAIVDAALMLRDGRLRPATSVGNGRPRASATSPASVVDRRRQRRSWR